MKPVTSSGRPCAGYGCIRLVQPPGGEPRHAADCQHLCVLCHNRLVNEIQELPRLYVDCGAALGGDTANGMREKISGGSLPGLVLNSVASEAKTGILVLLSSWCALVVEERQVRAPARQVVIMADFLLANICWLSSHAAVGDLSADVARTTKLARRAAYPEAVKRVIVGSCVIPGCEGELSATVRASRSGEGTQVRCSVNPAHEWYGHEWTQLRREMRRSTPDRKERWLTAADVSGLWQTPIGTVYRLASEQGWRRTARAGRTYYAETDVHTSFSRRKERTLRKG